MPRSSSPIGRVTGAAATDLGVEVTCAGGVLRLDALGDGIIRVRASPDGRFAAPADWDVLTQPAAAFDGMLVDDDADGIGLTAGTITARVDRSSGAVRFTTHDGVEFAADDGDGISWDTDRVRLRKLRHPAERHVGFGERSRLDQTAGTKTFWNVNARQYGPETDAMYCSVPVFLAVRPGFTYGFFLSCPGRGRIAADTDTSTWEAEVAGAELDYAVALADGPAGALERLTSLLGRIELPPRWALGYHQSHWGYDSAATVLGVADEFAGRRLPCDVIHLDINYMDGHRVFTWDPERFRDPAALVAELGRRGIRSVAIVDPGVKVEEGNDVYDDGIGRDAFLRRTDGSHVRGYVWPGECVFPDFLRPDVRAWWAGLHRQLFDAGVEGVWNDMNEPAIYAEPVGSAIAATVVEMPADALHGSEDRRVRHADVHNLYGLSMARAAGDAMRRLRPASRPFALTRSGYAGIQRHAAVWTGDNSSTWEHLRMSLPMLCNLGLSGVPFVGTDIGGFWGDAEPELFARWIQVGVLSPLMRGHSYARNRANQPWEFGPEVEAAAGAALRLRYELIPYLYGLFHEAATTGAPILRPLLWTDADVRATAFEDEVVLGDALLAAPVCHAGARHRDVYLPAGRWHDWWTGDVHDGPTDITVDAPLDRLPLFARAGALVPLAHLDAHGRALPSVLRLRVFAGDGDGALYDDDGETLAYRDGDFALRRYEMRSDAAGVAVRLSPVEGSYRPDRRLQFTTPAGATVEVSDSADGIDIVL